MCETLPQPHSAFTSLADSRSTLQQKQTRHFRPPVIIESSTVSSGGPFVSVKDIDWKNIYPDKSKKKVSKRVMIEPEVDLKKLADNEAKLRASGYYYGYLSWVDASNLLMKTKVGTFIVRDSEHCNYLYSLSVQTRRGPTSCRIEYENGFFRLDSAEDLTNEMPRFDNVTDLVEHYVVLTKNLPRNIGTKDKSPVWLDLDEEKKSRDVPVQIYKPLYNVVRSLQHMCRVNLVKLQREGRLSLNLRTNGRSSASDLLPTMLKNYLAEYPFSQ